MTPSGRLHSSKTVELAEQLWKPDYQAKQRLINFEQAMLLMAQVFGIPSDWIPEFLVRATDQSTSEADWVLEGLHAFASEHYHPDLNTKRFITQTIAEWCQE